MSVILLFAMVAEQQEYPGPGSDVVPPRPVLVTVPAIGLSEGAGCDDRSVRCASR